MLLALAPAKAQSGLVLPQGQSYELGVQPFAGYTYEWKVYDETSFTNEATPNEIEFLSPPTNPVVNILWKQAGTYFYKITVHNENGCMNTKIGKVVVTESLPTAAISPPNPVCLGDTAQLNITLTGQAPWNIVLYDGTNNITYSGIMNSTFHIPVNPLASTTYVITEVTDANGTNTTPSQPANLVVKPRPVSSHIYKY